MVNQLPSYVILLITPNLNCPMHFMHYTLSLRFTRQYPIDYFNQISFFDMAMCSKRGHTYKIYTFDAVA